MKTLAIRSRRAMAIAGVGVAALSMTVVGVPAHAADPVTGGSIEAALVDLVVLDTSSPDTITTTTPLRAGHEYAIDVVGSYGYEPNSSQADAECSTSTKANDTTWRRWRYVGAFNDFGNDPLDVYVDGRPVDWKPADVSGACDTVTHHYRILYTPESTAPVSFSLRDFYHGDNQGTLTLSVYFVGGVIDVGTRLIPDDLPIPPAP
jgi:hypothetical protein